jgi:glutamate N-acetyltransferase/amino-acid N-acetyltransferase
VTGIAKGAGMIKPDMATMLAFIATDATVEPGALQALTRELADRSFNRITIDGDTSTNDSCVLIASGAAGGPVLQPGHADWSEFALGVERVFVELARAIVRDGEGATKLVTVSVTGGDSEDACLRAAYAVAESPLVKTALFASDPNWGRILAAVGRSGVSGLRISDIHISIGGVPIVAAGEPVPGYDEAAVAEVMRGAEYEIAIGIGAGPARTAVLTCDFSFDYVKINAEYRS